MFMWVAETKLVDFIERVLTFCKPRIDTYAELAKVEATQLLIYLSSSDESNITIKVINTGYQLLSIVCELMCTDQ